MAISLKRRSEARPQPDSMTLVEHLTELRSRVLVCAVAFLITGTAAFLVYPWILSFLSHPYCQISPRHCGFYITGPLDGLALRVKIARPTGDWPWPPPVLVVGVLALRDPGAEPRQREAIRHPVHHRLDLPVRPRVPGGLRGHSHTPWPGSSSIGGPSLTQILDPNKYLSLIVLMMTMFGLTFEFPVLLVSLEIAGVLTPKQLSSWRRWAIVLIVVVAGVITPSSDPFSMMALAIPMYVFYEMSIVIGKLLGR